MLAYGCGKNLTDLGNEFGRIGIQKASGGFQKRQLKLSLIYVYNNRGLLLQLD